MLCSISEALTCPQTLNLLGELANSPPKKSKSITPKNKKMSKRTWALKCHENMKTQLKIVPDSENQYVRTVSREEIEAVTIDIAKKKLHRPSSGQIHQVYNKIERLVAKSAEDGVPISQIEKKIDNAVKEFRPLMNDTTPREENSNNKLVVSVATAQGKRGTNEDRYIILLDALEQFGFDGPETSFFGVYDGHAGHVAAEYARVHLHANILKSKNFNMENAVLAVKEGFHVTDDRFLKHATKEGFNSGTTALVALLMRNGTKQKLIVANAGDSVSFLCRRGEMIPMSVSYKPDRVDERRRIQASGGTVVFWGGQSRINGVLGVSRGIGDRQYKKFVIPDPYIREVELTKDDEFLIMATDGLWDVMGKKETMLFVQEVAKEFPNEKERVAQVLVNECLKRKTACDNITCLVIFFEH